MAIDWIGDASEFRRMACWASPVEEDMRLKCPRCFRRFDDIGASREHVEAVHCEGDR